MKHLLFLALIPVSASALETDNYLVWGKELRDSSTHINRYFREIIEEHLRKIPDQSRKSCEEMTEILAKPFASQLVHDNPVENWLFAHLNSEEIFPLDIHYVDESIYQEPYRFYIPWFGLAPNIQVNNYYFGTDKLSHFASTGMIYYKIFQKHLRKGKSPEEAEKLAIQWGIKDEKAVHGYWASGVFSYADLEANYQGLKFYRDFCEGERSYLKLEKTQWILVRNPDISDYVNAHWDETYELSYRLPGNWEKVSQILKERYCPLAKDPLVIARFAYYKNSQSSSSKNYLENLRASGKIPTPQSFTEVCSEFAR